jgi:hypothetical protein
MSDNNQFRVDVRGGVERIVQIREAENVTIGVPTSPTWARLLARLSWRAETWLIESRILSAPQLLESERGYLEWYVSQTERRLDGGLVYVPLNAAPGPPPDASNEWLSGSLISPRDRVRRIRQSLRLIKQEAGGGDLGSARMTAAKSDSRLIWNVIKFLDTVRVPVVLLGDPGSGKSTTLLEIGIRIAERGRRRARPMIPVYVPLATYRGTFDNDDPAEILALIRRSIPSSHSEIRASVETLIRERRLVVLFDGMDEMERTVYADRVRKLSEFASGYAGRVKSLFACRTNDFIVTFNHQQIVLQPFTVRQVREYVRRNLQLPITVDGVRYDARLFVRRLVSSRELGDAIYNPLTLYLIRRFITDNCRWPRSQTEIFITYLDSIFSRLNSLSGRKRGRPDEEKLVRSGWAELAFEIARERGGAYIQVAQLKSRWSEARANFILESGLRSGLLTVEYVAYLDGATIEPRSDSLPAETDSVGFFHHRLQEFLCAEHLAAQAVKADGLDWDQLIDSPRWQETLLDLVSMRGGKLGALEVIEKSLK